MTDDATTLSRQETLTHIASVQTRMEQAIDDLKARTNRHDLSKLKEPELSGFAHAKQRLAGAVYGTPGYQALLDEHRPIIQQHYAVNDHHPEHYKEGIDGMSLLSVLEMLCDWKAAGERTKDGSMARSLKVNIVRFGIDEQLAGLLLNTASALGWLEGERP